MSSLEGPLPVNSLEAFALAARRPMRLVRRSPWGWLEPITGSQERCHGGQPGAASPQGGSEPILTDAAVASNVGILQDTPYVFGVKWES